MSNPNCSGRKSPRELIGDIKGTEEEEEAFRIAKSHPLFIEATSFRDQVGILCTYLRNEQVRVSYERIAKLFPDTTKQTVQNQYNKYSRTPKGIGRPEKLNEEDIQKNYEEIIRLHSHQPYPIYPTFNDIFDFVHLTLKKLLKWIHYVKKSIKN